MAINYYDIFKRIPILQTERLTLRKISSSDLYDVYDYSKDYLVCKYLLWNPHPSIDFTKQYLKTVSSYYKAGKFYDWGIVFKETEKMIGTVGFSAINIENNSAEIGYVINRRYWGLGIATEAAKRVIDFGFKELHLHRIEAHYIQENTASKRILEKCNMTFEGVLREAIKAKGEFKNIGVFSIIENEFNSYCQ